MRRTLLALAAVGALAAAALPVPAAAVVGGQRADPGEWPWQVVLLVNGEVWCGGSVVAADLVLTAAHCTDGMGPRQFTVVGGTVDLTAGDGQRRQVASIDQHEGYDEAELRNDVSLLTLDEPFVLGDDLATVQLATAEQSLAGTEEGDRAVVTGFGATGEDADASDVLLEATVETVADRRCQALYRQDGDTVFGSSEVCAGVDSGATDACYGDSGGPLVVPLDPKGTEWRLVGIVSWGAGCGEPERPTVYTEVAAFGSWLRERGIGRGAGAHAHRRLGRVPAHGTQGKAARYPAEIELHGFDGLVESVAVRLVGLSHERPADLDIWLVAPDGTTVTLLSDVGGEEELDDVEVVVVDGAHRAGAERLGALVAPTDREGDSQRRGARPRADLTALRGIDPNGTWRLLVADDSARKSGRLESWELLVS